METYYSQHGEDFLTNLIFKNKAEGYFVEIGCLDGIEYSNTYFFEKRGWKGACIEAHNDFVNSLKINRPNSTIVHCAVGEADKENVTFYANKLGSLSTLDKGEEERYKRDYKEHFFGFEEQTVPMRTLTTVFDELNIKKIDFVSLDIEGYEVFALKGLDFSKYKPKLFIVEYKDDTHKQQLDDILLPNGYFFVGKIGCNSFYSVNQKDERILADSYGNIKLLHIDINGNKNWHYANLLRPTFIRKVKYHLKKILKSR